MTYAILTVSVDAGTVTFRDAFVIEGVRDVAGMIALGFIAFISRTTRIVTLTD